MTEGGGMPDDRSDVLNFRSKTCECPGVSEAATLSRSTEVPETHSLSNSAIIILYRRMPRITSNGSSRTASRLI